MAFAESTPQNGIYSDPKLVSQSQTGIPSTDVKGILKGIPGIAGAVGLSSKFNLDISTASSQISNAFKLGSSFLSDPTLVASEISKFVGDVFTDKTIKTAATTTSQIPDPVSKNLSSPASSIFSISPFEVGSQTTSPTGSKSIFGSLSDQMTGSGLSTLIDRYVTEDIKKLGQVISKKAYSDSLNNLFLSVSKITNVISSTGKTSISSIVDQLQITPKTTSASSSQSSFLNDYSAFIGETTPLAKSLGKTDLSEFYFSSSPDSTTLISGSGDLLSTHDSGIDSITANQAYKLAVSAGCNLPAGGYNSYLNKSSLYNAALNTASLYGLDNLLTSLVTCVTATSELGQRAIKGAFGTSSSSRISSALLLLDGILNVADVATRQNKVGILTNPNLTSTNVGDVNSVMSTLGSSVTDEVTIPNLGATDYPLYDISILSQMNSSFTDAALDDSIFSDIFQGSEVRPLQTGVLEFV